MSKKPNRAQIVKVIKEYDKLGAMKFLKKHNYRRSMKYRLYYKNKIYDSKAIYGVASGQDSDDFSGGGTTTSYLKKLRFEILDIPDTKMSLKKLDFTDWVHLNEIGSNKISAEKLKFSGIYLVAIYEKRPGKKVRKDDSSIVYIGETVDQTLKKRLDQFRKSAANNKNRHSGGMTFRYLSKNNKIGKIENAYVSLCPMPKRASYIRLIERCLISEYDLKNGEMPKCNRK
jgi:hypothetical protein